MTILRDDPDMKHLYVSRTGLYMGYMTYCGQVFSSPDNSRNIGECPVCQEEYFKRTGEPFYWPREWARFYET